jgi:DNA-binding LacI/PurR family transcriptional regulator
MTASGSARVTSADVARAAGVSRATVSYVLNDAPNQTIPEATRERVRTAARRLGYAPSAAARALRRGRSDVVLLVFPRWPIGHTTGQLIETLTAELAAHDLALVVHQLGDEEGAFAALWRAVSPAAVITVEPFSASETAAVRAAGIPVTHTLLDAAPGRGGALTRAQIRVGRLQVEHLAATGHRRVGYALPGDPRVQAFAEPRLEGVRIACGELGLDLPVVQIVTTAATPTHAVAAWRDRDHPVTAVCAYNDEVAMAVLAALDEQGLRAPEDLAVIGVDDIPLARFARPPLTTIRIDQAAAARHAAAVIVNQLAGRPAPPPPDSDTVELAVRASA